MKTRLVIIQCVGYIFWQLFYEKYIFVVFVIRQTNIWAFVIRQTTFMNILR